MKIRALSSIGFITISCTIFSACGEIKDADKKEAKPTEKSVVNGQDAAKYYAQFTSKKVAKGPQDIKVLSSSFSIPQFNQAYPVSLSLLILDDGTYSGQYLEVNTGQTLNLSGKWQIKGTNLILGSLGTAAGAVINGHQGFILMINEDLLSPGIKGKTFTFTI